MMPAAGAMPGFGGASAGPVTGSNSPSRPFKTRRRGSAQSAQRLTTSKVTARATPALAPACFALERRNSSEVELAAEVLEVDAVLGERGDPALEVVGHIDEVVRQRARR